MKLYTIGYGGRTRDDFLAPLRKVGVRTLVDIRLRPDRASMGLWVKAKSADAGIEKLLADAGIGYRSVVELGNPFLGLTDWPARYAKLIERAGDLLTERLADVPAPYCLMCAEKRVAECHRRVVAEFLAKSKGYEVVHLE